jgi:polyisoprenoid-binding protein YceI
MKKVSFFLLGAAFLASSFAFASPKTPKAPITLAVQSDKSRVDFIGSKAADFHTGSFTVKGGSVQVEAGKLVGGSFVIDLANLKVTDAAGDRLAGHLKSPDFFDVAKFGEATYTISSVNYTSATACTINGNLNIKGVPVPVSFAANIRSASEKGLFGQAYFSLDRTLLGIAYAGPSNDVQIAVHLFAK